VRLTLLPRAPRPIADHADLQLHLGATALPVRVLPLQPRRLVPGASGFAQLVLHTPVSALHGDRFVLRDPSAHALVGGGTVLDASAPLRGRASESRIAELQALETDNAAQALASLLQLRADGVDETSFARQRNLDAAALTHLRTEVRAQSVSTRAGTRLMATERWAALLQAALHAVTVWHADQPASLGMPEPALLNAMRTTTGVNDKKLCQAAVRAALDNGSIEHGGHVLRRPGHEARLAPDDAALLQQVHLVMQPMGLRPPPLGDLAVLLGLPLQDTAVALQRMATLGHLVQVAKNRFFLPQTLQALMQIARDTAAAAPEGRFDAASFRDRSGVGRNLSIQLLEFFDRVGFTRYANEWRVIAE
jgi:selenocysteine-specific elongation factor